MFLSALLFSIPRRRRSRVDADNRRAVIAQKFDRLWQAYPLGAEFVESLIDDLLSDEETRAGVR